MAELWERNMFFYTNDFPCSLVRKEWQCNRSFIANLVNDMSDCNHSGIKTRTSWSQSLLNLFWAFLESVSPQWQHKEDPRETSFLTWLPSWGLPLCYDAQSSMFCKIMLWRGSQMLMSISCYPPFGLKHLGSSLGPTRCFSLEAEAWINVLCLWIKQG